jgi:signal transduction histidine kinase
MKQLLVTIFKNRPLAVVVIGFLLTIATFIGNIVLTYDITTNLRGNVNRIENIYNELALLAELKSDLAFAENSLKNYLISGQSIYLRSHERALERIEKNVKNLITKENGGNISPKLFVNLTQSLKERFEIFKKTKTLAITREEAKLNQARDLISEGANKSLDIRETLTSIENDLRISLQINRKYVERSISYGSYSNYLAICIALVVAFFATISITQDYARQKEIERILRQLNDDKTKLFSILGHDLRSPLSGINAVIYILKNHYQSLTEAEIKEYIDSLEQTSLNYGKLLEDVLTWSRLQLDKIQINPQPYELKLLSQEVIDLYTDQLLNKNLLISNLVPSTQILKVDKAMLQTVLRNLVSNAVKYSHTGGQIKVTFREDKDWNFIDVTDNGVGMNAAVIKTLFTNSTISMAGTENEVGTGLGLSICKEFLAKEGGDLRVSSQEGKGSVFSIVLPKEEMYRKIKSSKKLLPKSDA